ncbi:MAG: glycosyltransferase [Candidatus Krumholzibacteriota bacterium]|nr:glycosyltransferase [Candidatus Krumholzibacteriota bacterium]
MKIAYVHTGQWPSNSPSTTFATYNAVGLANVFRECHLFIKKNFNSTIEEVLTDYFGVKKSSNLFIYPYENHFHINSNRIYYRYVYKTLRKLIVERTIDAVISRNVSFLPYLAELKKNYNIPALFESHDYFADLSSRDDINISKKMRYHNYERKYIPRISGVICLQQIQREQYLKEFPKQNIFVCRTGIHRINTDAKSEFNNRKYVGYIGSLEKHKGVEDIIKAASISDSKPDILLIGGKNSSEIKKYYRIAENLYNRKKITITGWVNKVEMREYIDRIRIGVVPLMDTYFNRYLTSPLKLFDFYSYGIPVISSDLPTMRELIDGEETGFFYKSGDIKKLSEKIDLLFENKEVYAEMRLSVLKKAEQYLWVKRADKIKKILKDL